MDHLFSRSRLVRTEITTLIGLMIRQPLDFTHPGFAVLESHVQQTEALLSELHGALGAAMFASMFTKPPIPGPSPRPDLSGSALREPIFYGGESAYGFQYRDFAEHKYVADDGWLLANKGFSITEARKTVAAVAAVEDRKMMTALEALKSMSRDAWTMLPGFAFNTAEVAEQANLGVTTVAAVLNAFAFAGGTANAGFSSLHAYNASSGTPLLRKDQDEFVLLQQYSLFEALYESPFYWLGADKQYAPTALKNRGVFTEALAWPAPSCDTRN